MQNLALLKIELLFSINLVHIKYQRIDKSL